MRIKVIVGVLFVVLSVPTIARGQCDWKNFDQCEPAQASSVAKEQVITSRAEREVVGINATNTIPATFSSPVHNGLQDFLNRFIASVSQLEDTEDGQEVDFRWNVSIGKRQKLGLMLSLAEPQVSDLVANAIPEAVRTDTVADIRKGISDLDNQVWSLSYTLEGKECGATGACWGRSPELYRSSLHFLREGILKQRNPGMKIDGDGGVDDWDLLRFSPDTSASMDIKSGEARTDSSGGVAAIGTNRAAAFKERVRIEKMEAYKRGNRVLHDPIAKMMTDLINNQPQLALTVSYHDPGTFGGPEEDSASLDFQMGPDNLNSFRKIVSNGGRALERKMRKLEDGENPVASDQFVVSARYKKLHSYTLTDLGLDATVVGFTAIDQPEASTITLHAQWGRNLQPEVAGGATRIDFALDGIRARDNDLLTKDRLVASATLAIPAGLDVVLPITLTWANKSEFLDEDAKKLGLHFGLTFRIPPKPSGG